MGVLGVFKGFYHAHCAFVQKNIELKILKFLINVFYRNGHSITVLEKVTKKYMNNITSVKEKENIDTIKNDKIVKLAQVPKLGPTIIFTIF